MLEILGIHDSSEALRLLNGFVSWLKLKRFHRNLQAIYVITSEIFAPWPGNQSKAEVVQEMKLVHAPVDDLWLEPREEIVPDFEEALQVEFPR